MDRDSLIEILTGVKEGTISIDKGIELLKDFPFLEVDFAKIDTHRMLRTGIPEVIFGQGKSIEEIEEIASMMLKKGLPVLVTRLSKDKGGKLKEDFKEGAFFEKGGVFLIGEMSKTRKEGRVAVICAGTSDIPVAEEAAIILDILGNPVERVYDVGAAGIHRLLNFYDSLKDVKVMIVIAGMEGALATISAGIFGKPVIAVPTSVGYGASFKGLSALLGMLNSCAPGVVVVNIDNGFGAAYFANLINS